MWCSALAVSSLFLALTPLPGIAQSIDAKRLADAERRAAEAERRAAAAEQRAAIAGAPASAGSSAAPGVHQQRFECQAARRNFEVFCSRRAMETAWEARECAAAAQERQSQCGAAGSP